MPSKLTSGMAAPVGLLIAVALAACGSAGPPTTTIKLAQARKQEANCSTLTSACPAPPKHATVVINCGGGLTTNGSCVFANNVERAYRAARRVYGSVPSGVTVTSNPVACTGSPGDWRCQSRRSEVWVQFKGA
jgi:hypothetical protein